MASSTSSARMKTQKTDPKAPGMGRRERSKLEKRARITSAARKLFAKHGFAATTTQEIADAADIGTGTLFLYAKTKEDLLLMVFRDELTANAKESFEGLPDKATFIDQIMSVFENMVAYHESDIGMAVTLTREILIPRTPEHNADLQEMMDTILDGLESIIMSAQESKDMSDAIEPRLIARSVFSLYIGGLLTWLGGRQTTAQFLSSLRTQLTIFGA